MFRQDIDALRKAEQREDQQSVMKTALHQGVLITWNEIVPFRKREEPEKRSSPTPPHRPAPAQPYRHAAELRKHDTRPGDQLIAALRRA